MSVRRVSLCALLLSMLMTAVWFVPSMASASGPSRPAAATRSVVTAGPRFVDITAADGAILKANVIAPATPGRHPAIVFVASWSVNDYEYLVQAKQFAAAGYVVLSYTPRGFWQSGGGIEVAGPLDWGDFSSVLDWLIANTDTDPARIGAGGISYGGGISLVSAAHDPRVRAVAAMSVWTDLVASLYGNATRRGQAVGLLKLTAELTGRPSPGLKEAIDAIFGNRDSPAVKAWAYVRSAMTYTDMLNRSGTAVLIANSYGDSLFPPNQLVDFYGKLTGPKRLELAPGDHAVVEATGLAGLPNHAWQSVRRWFDQYVAGIDTGIDHEGSVILRPRGSSAVETAADWSSAVGTQTSFSLGPPRWYDATGALAAGAAGGWQKTILSGVDTVAGGGIAILTNGWEALTGNPPSAWMPAVNRFNAMVWVSNPLAGGGRVRGIVRSHLTITPNVNDGTIVAYLYDMDALGGGKLITHVPYTGGTAGVPIGLTVDFPVTAYDVPDGHRLALVIDTKDPLYLDTNKFGSFGISSPAADPSWLSVPLK